MKKQQRQREQHRAVPQSQSPSVALQNTQRLQHTMTDRLRSHHFVFVSLALALSPCVILHVSNISQLTLSTLGLACPSPSAENVVLRMRAHIHIAGRETWQMVTMLGAFDYIV